jgi:endo-1,4-beta-xylanase
MAEMTNYTGGFTRRTFFLAALATAGVSALRPMNAFGMTKTLRELADDKGITFGSAISAGPLQDPSFAGLFARQCRIAVPELALKWAAIRPTPDRFDFSAGDSLYEFSKSHGLLFRGHALVWEQALPKWFGYTVTAENANKMMIDHISTVARHYAGKMHSWDVVNEAFQIEDGRPDGLKITPWLRLIGPEYIETAFHAAHEADPQGTLVYNENWLEPEDAGTDRKRNAVLTMLTRLKKNNVPVHALGIQSHLYANTNTSNAGFRRFLQEVSDLGLGIMITEMDVRDKNAPADIVTRDRLIASQYYKHLSFMLQFPAVKTVITWGLSDRYTWIATHDPRADGMPVRPLPYDAELKPTPAYDAIRKAFEEAGRR